ncbi:response regulator [Rhodobacterales bacterium HKCCSP123]|nr:response regulator [Rhodobacterales bacterium HKCCSP123]
MKILAVDDDRDFLAYLAVTLGELGYKNVTLANSASEGIRKIDFAVVDFDCIILDVQMPDMDGIELCARIRSMRKYRDTPIVMATTMADRDHIDRAFMAGATDYLTKPLDKVETRARLGVVHQLVREQLRANFAVANAGRDIRSAPAHGFMDSIPLKKVDGAIDMFAMSNYLTTMGIFRAVSMSAVGVQVTNAQRIHEIEGGGVFSEVMVDVANCLSDSLSGTRRMLSYAGGGTFVVLASRSAIPNAAEFGARINRYVSEFEAVYSDLGITLPEVTVGPAIHFRVSQLRAPRRLVEEAVARARETTGQVAVTA